MPFITYLFKKEIDRRKRKMSHTNKHLFLTMNRINLPSDFQREL